MGKAGAFLLMALLLPSLLACAGPRNGASDTEASKEELINALTLFVESVQGDRFAKAFGYLTPSERAKMAGQGGAESPDLQRRLKALRLSTLANKPGVRLDEGKLEGIYEQLPSLAPPSTPPPEAETEVPSFQ